MSRTPVVDGIRRLLTEYGPMTPGHLAHELGLPIGRVSETLRRWAKATPRRAYIAAWDRPPENKCPRLVPLYALGDQPDARKPAALPRTVTNRRYWARYAERRRAATPGLDLQTIWSQR